MYTLNTLLCAVCVAVAAGIVFTHIRTPRTTTTIDDTTAYLGGEATPDGDEVGDPTRAMRTLMGNPFVAETDASHAARRWHEKLEQARAKNAADATTTPRRTRRPTGTTASSRSSSRRRALGARQHQQRRSRTMFERTRHYDRYQYEYERGSGSNAHRRNARLRTGRIYRFY